jgi:uncharacterized membrane protein
MLFGFLVLLRLQTPAAIGRATPAGRKAEMIFLCVVAVVAAFVIGLAFYQSYMHQQRWKRISRRKEREAAAEKNADDSHSPV